MSHGRDYLGISTESSSAWIKGLRERERDEGRFLVMHSRTVWQVQEGKTFPGRHYVTRRVIWERTREPPNQKTSQPLSQATSVRASLGSDPAAHSHPYAESEHVTRTSATAALRTPLPASPQSSVCCTESLASESEPQAGALGQQSIGHIPALQKKLPIKFLVSAVGCCGLTGGKIGSLGKVFKCEKQPKQ